MKRTATLKRITNETQIELCVTLDGSGKNEIDTGIGFFDHMLQLFSCHSGFDLKAVCKGDLQVDGHHTVEDVGIVLGKAVNQALGDKKGIARYSSKTIPMDEALATVTVDVSGRPYLAFNAELAGKVGEFDLELVEEFFRAVSTYGGITLHVNLHYGTNSHHKAECIFKAFARAMKEAVSVVGTELPSSKGLLE